MTKVPTNLMQTAGMAWRVVMKNILAISGLPSYRAADHVGGVVATGRALEHSLGKGEVESSILSGSTKILQSIETSC
jgi:hypothetical protein